ncbi:hypothetical protein D3C72_100090 [compost metagenome]
MLSIIFLALALVCAWLASVAYRTSKGIRELPFKVLTGDTYDFLSGTERIEMQERWSRRIGLNHYIWILFSVLCVILAISTLVMDY